MTCKLTGNDHIKVAIPRKIKLILRPPLQPTLYGSVKNCRKQWY